MDESGVFTTRRGMEIPAVSVSSRKEVAKKHAQPSEFLALLNGGPMASLENWVQWLVSGKTESLFLGSCILSWAFGRIEDRVAKRIDVSTLLLVLLLILAEFIGIVSSNVILDKSDLGGLSTKHYGGVDRCSCLLIWCEKMMEMVPRLFRCWGRLEARLECNSKRW
jgi:hypothetical protein